MWTWKGKILLQKIRGKGICEHGKHKVVVETVEVQSIVLTTSRNHDAMNVEGKDNVNITKL